MAKRIARILAIIVVGVILLNIILFITFSIPAVQKRAADFALEKLEPVIGTETDLDGIRIRLFNTVELMGLYVEDQQQDTLFYAGKIAARIRVLDLLRNKVTVQKVGLENFKADLHRETADDPFNFQFIVDAFATGEGDPTVEKKEKKPWRITAEEVILKNGAFRYDIQSAPNTPGQFNSSHLDVDNFNFKGRVDFLSTENMQAEVQLLTFLERNSGLLLSELEAGVVGKGTLIKSNKLHLSLNQSEIEVADASYDRASKAFSVTLNSEQLDPKDVGLFYTPLTSLDKFFSLEIEAEGQLPQINLTKLDLQYGEDTRFDIVGMISDYNNITDGDMWVDIRNLSVSQPDLDSIISVWAHKYSSPKQLTALGNIDLQMKTRGGLGNFNYDGYVMTEQGDVTLNGVGNISKDFKDFSFEGPVTANDIQVANIIGEGAGVGNTTLYTTAKVIIPKDSALSVTADGTIESVVYKDYLYNDLHFDGIYSDKNVALNVNMDSPLNQFDLSGDITFGDRLEFIVNGMVQQLDLRPFIMMENWKTPSLTTRIEGRMGGTSIDDMVGTVVIDHTSLVDSNFIYNPGPLYLQAFGDDGEGKRLQLTSSFLEAEVTGDYYFSSIAEEMMQTMRPHLPSIITVPTDHRSKVPGKASLSTPASSILPQETSETKVDNEMPGGSRNDFQFNILLNNTEDFSYTFGLPFYNVDQATISGNVNMAGDGSVNINAHIPRLMFGNNDIRETKADLQSGQSGISLNVNSYLAQNNGYVNTTLNSYAAQDSVVNRLAFDVRKRNNNLDGEMLITMGFDRDADDQLASNIRIHPTIIDFNGKDIDINDATIAYRKDWIGITNFGIGEEGMLLLGIDGVASKSEADNIRIYFNNTELENILTAFNISNIAGSINGNIYIRQALETPMIRTEELRIEDITVYNDTIGTLMIDGDWDQIYSGLNLNAYLTNEGERNLNIAGYIPTGSKSPIPMDVSILMEDFDLYAFQPFAADALSKLSGRLNSNIHVTGNLSEPVAEGWLGINDGEMRVAYTNVTYSLSDTIQIKKDNVGIENLVIRDQNNHAATLDVRLSHTNFGQMVYTAGISLDDFMLLNNEERTDLMVYGDLRLSGKLNVTGSSMGIYGDGNLTTRSPSEVTVALPQTAKATEYSGVVYINTHKTDSLAFLRKSDEPVNQTNSGASSGIPIVVRATVDLNPMLEAAVILDPTTGNTLEVSGEGEINLNYNSKSTPPTRIYGDYVFNSGKFHYNLQNFRMIDFSIREGSKLTMEGDPANTQFNIIAYLPVKADLSALSPTFTTELANTRVPVNALLQIKGDLDAMDLQYDIELPESTTDIQQRVKSFIPDEETKILQFAYLATTGNFIPSEGSPDLNFGSSVFSRFAANTLARGLDALFANALNDNWSVSTNLESVDGSLDNVRMGVDVSTRLLNNRLRMSTNLSYGDNSMLETQQAFMGEFELEYDINNWLMFRAFNRANERFYRRTPTTQGIGVVVTKEAQSFRDLFNFRFTNPKVGDE